MKVLFCLFDDFFTTTCLAGGLTGHSENLAWGFRELGHQVDIVMFRRHKNKIIYSQKTKNSFNWLDTSAFEVPLNTNLGWCVPENRHFTLDDVGVEQFREFSTNYDIIVWESLKMLSGAQSFDLFGDKNFALYKNGAKANIGVVHVGSSVANRGWAELLDFIQRISVFGVKFVGVYPFATNTLPDTIIKKTIYNPFHVVQDESMPWRDREIGFLTACRFVSSKRVDNILRAIPYMQRETSKWLAGDGFERYRMQKPLEDPTIDPKYIASVNTDPDLDSMRLGRRIWDNALDNGLSWIGRINEDRRNAIAKGLRAILDASYIKATVKHGEFFHRTTIDPMLLGSIPIRAYMCNADHSNYLLKPNENYVGIPNDATPKEFAEIVDIGLRDETLALKILENNVKVLPNLDRKVIAQQYIDFAFSDEKE